MTSREGVYVLWRCSDLVHSIEEEEVLRLNSSIHIIGVRVEKSNSFRNGYDLKVPKV